jgi:hypothetical protein
VYVVAEIATLFTLSSTKFVVERLASDPPASVDGQNTAKYIGNVFNNGIVFWNGVRNLSGSSIDDTKIGQGTYVKLEEHGLEQLKRKGVQRAEANFGWVVGSKIVSRTSYGLDIVVEGVVFDIRTWVRGFVGFWGELVNHWGKVVGVWCKAKLLLHIHGWPQLRGEYEVFDALGFRDYKYM